ncbi:MAG: F0F1 ATP synthase subunit A [Bdellovibrionales bacterium]|nr:F0F1 ATP synthase subunit A [Bdellovibrionales bacterium]
MQSHGSAHHGPESWLTKLPFLPQQREWESVNGAVLVFVLILVVSLLVNRIIKGKIQENVIPRPKVGLFSVIDLLVEALYNLIVGIVGHHYGAYAFPFIASIFIYVLLNNLLGLLPMSASPSAAFPIAFALGISSFIFYNWMGVKANGLIGYGKHFLMGLGVFGIPIAGVEMISHVIRPFTLGLRLRTNMHIDHMLAGAFAELCKWIVPVPLLLFGVVVCTIQAFLFAVLTAVYVQMATEHEE